MRQSISTATAQSPLANASQKALRFDEASISSVERPGGAADSMGAALPLALASPAVPRDVPSL